MLPHRHLHLSASLTAGLLAAERGSNDQAQCLDATGVGALLVGQHGPRGHERSYVMSKYTIQSRSQIFRVKYMPRPRIVTCAGLFGFQDLAIYTCSQHIHSMGQQGSRQTYLLQTWRTRCTSDVSYRTTAEVRAAGNRGGLPRLSRLAFFFLALHLRQAICLGAGVHGFMKICAVSCDFGVAIMLCSLVSYFGNVEVEGGWKFWTACPEHEDGELWGMVYQSSRLA